MKFPSFSLEYSLFSSCSYIAGIDEVGRGCLAGPVVAGIVIVTDASHYLAGVRDSKTMSEIQRERFADRIKKVIPFYSIGTASAEEIDSGGIRKATHLAMLRAYWSLPVTPDIILMDGESATIPILNKTHQYNYGDSRFYSIAAASIIAKVYRDSLMKELALSYPEYGFESHKGYGTTKHYQALRSFGMTPLHRRTFTHL